MKTKIVRIGNSQGIRIPKTLLRQCHLEGPLEIDVQGNQLVVRSASRLRHDWDKAFREMHHRQDDRLVDAEASFPTRWDRDEWEWWFTGLKFTSFASILLKVEQSEKPAPV